jgi:hypothetical protein
MILYLVSKGARVDRVGKNGITSTWRALSAAALTTTLVGAIAVRLS